MMKKIRGIYEHPPGSGIFWIHWYDHRGQRHREKAGTRNSAKTLYQKRKADSLLRKKLPELLRQRGVSFAEIAKDALVWSDAHKSSAKDDHVRMKALTRLFGDKAAEEVEPSEIENSLSGNLAGRSPSTLNRYLALMSLCYRLAERNGKVKANPLRLVKRHREDNAQIRWITTREEKKIRKALRKRWPQHIPEFDIAIHTGLRRSQQYSLTWPSVEFESQILTVPAQKRTPPRHLRLNSVALAAFQKMRKMANGSERVFQKKAPRYWFGKAVKAAGVENLRWHDLRHTFASRLVMAGVHLRVVQELMGHQSIAMTMRYAHLAPAMHADAVERLVGFDAGKVAKMESRTAIKTATRLRRSA
jgi:integrase